MIGHLEGIVDEALASLKDELPGRIEILNAETGAANPSEIALDDVDDDAYYFGGFDIVKYPSIEVAAPDWRVADFSLGLSHAELRTAVMVRAHFMDSTAERVYRRGMRYGRAILDIMLQPEAFGAGTEVRKDDGVRGYYRFNPETGEKEEIFGSTLLVFTLEAEEMPT